ncbi:hypothetical protein GCK72_007604 [Caenorhabditis remanei]|uniref:SCP domain-containing protein n=1 Tax=Caenorhabditis remanei TaxID=31234 RepID=A0A6A5HJH8_CAERE|nr:hypothetical protein GCK72_007604 [Caenorhabditis remanei]KAF1767645.1 hypothetical protein GCK72_007604 [Caenorhabditis remanei]
MVCTPWILTFFLIAAASQSQKTPELEKKVENHKILIDVLNNFRRQTANKLQIAYMHELIYDESLYQQFDLRYKKDIPSFEIANYTTVFKNLKSYTRTYWEKSETWVYRGSAIRHGVSEDIIQYLSPLQQKVRCIEMENGLKCFLGPIKERAWWYYSNGEPGSKCDEGFYNDFGLCSRIVPVSESTSTKAGILFRSTTTTRSTSDSDEDKEECDCSVSTRLQIFIIFAFCVYFLI